MKYKKSDFPSLESVDKKEFEISSTCLDSYDGERETIFVPYGVTEIAEFAFQNKEYDTYDDEDESRGSEYLEEVIFPDTVQKIGRQPFYGCKYLRRVYISESVTLIDGDIFTGCPALEEIEVDKDNPAYKMVDGCFIDIRNKTLICGLAGCKIPADGSVAAIGRYAFNMRELESIEIPEGIVKLENYTFTGCDKLKEVKLPSTLEEIGNGAFSMCSALTKISHPENLKRIGETAFGHSGIKEITLPDGLEYVGKSAFWYSGLQSIKLSSTCKYEHALFENCKYLKKAEFLDGWKKIPTSCFKESGIEEVILPESVEEIGVSAFSFCHYLKKITLPPNLKKIGNKAFYCSGLEEIDFPQSLKTVEYCAFGWCNHLKHITVPPKVVENETDVFWKCEGLESVVIQEGTIRIVKSSFSGCKKLKSVTFPDSLVKIGSYAFGECRALKEVSVPQNTEIIGDAFYKCGVEPIDELALMDMTMEEYRALSSVQSNIKITRR